MGLQSKKGKPVKEFREYFFIATTRNSDPEKVGLCDNPLGCAIEHPLLGEADNRPVRGLSFGLPPGRRNRRHFDVQFPLFTT